jgi:hypothetical protein
LPSSVSVAANGYERVVMPTKTELVDFVKRRVF